MPIVQRLEESMDENGDQPVQPAHERWTDMEGRTWDVELAPGVIALHGEPGRIELVGPDILRDLFISPWDGGVLLRFETFDLRAAFVLSRADAERSLGTVGFRRSSAPQKDSTEEEERSATSTPLLFPKVSPLAIWALISSALVFVPIVGLVPAVATMVLLGLHRRRVRRSAAWEHSRSLCRVAASFLVLGLAVSAIGTYWLVRNVQAPRSATPASFDIEGPSLSRPHSNDVQAPGGSKKGNVLAQVTGEERNWGLIGIGLIVLLISLTFHEAAHAITAWWLGDDFARRLGRVTLNPAAHIDLFGTVLLPIVLFLASAPIFGYAKPVPVRSEVFRSPRRDDILVSIAGPGANLFLSAISLALLLGLSGVLGLVAPEARLTGLASPDIFEPSTASGFAGAQVFAGVVTFLRLSFQINLFLAFFNLIPIPPLDGSWVLGHLFPRTIGPLMDRIRPYGIIIFAVAVFSNLFQYLMIPMIVAFIPALLLLEWCTPF
ncbi:MAG: site-2 protease family protein [Phycisphaerae bacterium]|nr:site-2 protease family protein [Phycisphaerae bacterium]